jgi:hypothetical protein
MKIGKELSILVVALLLSSCTKAVMKEPPLRYSFMPSYLDVDSLLSYELDDTSRVVDSSYTDFRTIPVDPGLLITEIGDTFHVPGGLLISERKAALYLFYESGWKRQNQELRYLKYLMKEQTEISKSAEVLYQKRIKDLRQESKRSWLERNHGYLGFVAGAVTVIMVNFAVFQAGGSN